MIHVDGLRVMCHVGVPEAERAQAQPLEIDLSLDVDLARAADSDDVADTVDYGAVAIAVADAVTAAPIALLERVAAVAGDAALAVDSRTSRVVVRVRKLRPPVPVDVASTAVMLERHRR